MIVRHAEKAAPDQAGIDPSGEEDRHSLPIQGWLRAGAFVPFFAPMNRPLPEPRVARPAHLIAESPEAPESEPKKSKREEQTLAPLSDMLGVEPDFSFGRGQEAEAAAAAKQCSGPVLIAWEHHDLFKLAQAISSSEAYPAKWPSERFDIVLVFRLRPDGESYSYEQVPQLLLAGDSETLIRD